jgi:phosphatidylglycerol---prolipoprotein diacylglyceryl transferase
MRQTLFHIPHELLGIPVLGLGLLAAVWALFIVIYLVLNVRWYGWSQELLSSLFFSVLIGLGIVFLLPHIAEPAGLPIRGYGFMMLLAVAAGLILALYRARQVGLPDDVIYALAMWMILPGIIGARLFYVIEYRDKFFAQGMSLADSLKRVASIQEGGLVVFGSLIGAMVGLAIFVSKYRLPLLPLMDVVAPSMAIGQAIGRVGCFLNGCCFGGTCDLNWAVTFPIGSPPYVEQVEKGKLAPLDMEFKDSVLGTFVEVASVKSNSSAAEAGMKPGMKIKSIIRSDEDGKHANEISTRDPGERLLTANSARMFIATSKPGDQLTITTDDSRIQCPIENRSLPIHPTQLYSAIDATLLCLLLLAWSPFCRHHGEIIALTLMLHAISRFLLEVIRIDEASMFGTGLSISQLISVGMLTMGALLWGYLRWSDPLVLRIQRTG